MENNKKIRVLGILLVLLLLGSSLFLVYDLYLMSGIETFYRIMLALFILFFDFLIIKAIFCRFLFKIRKKKILPIFIVSLILTIVYATAGIFIYSFYIKIDSLNKNYITYTSSLITFNKDYKNIKNIKDTTIGIINNKDDVEGYQIPMEIIKKYNLDKDNEIKEYKDTVEMVQDLYDKKIDLTFVTNNYKITYKNIDGFEDIGKKAIVVTEKSKKMKKDTKIKSTEKKLITEPFTMLLLGVDSEKDGLNPNQAFNGDTIMLITFNPETLNTTMFSIPRDTYVPIACNHNYKNKINSAAAYGTDCMINTVENLTDIKIDHYTKINFKGVVELVDALGGVTVDVPIEFCEQNSDRKKGSHKICLKKGVQKLTGEEALALSRHRKTLVKGDFSRGQNQQLVVEAMTDQIKNVKSVKTFYNILEAVSKNMDTDLSTNQILSFYNIAKKMMFSDNNNVLNIQKTYLTGSDGHAGSAYIFNYDTESLNDIIDAMKVNLNIKKAKKIKTFDFSINTKYERKVIGDTNNSSSIEQVG